MVRVFGPLYDTPYEIVFLIILLNPTKTWICEKNNMHISCRFFCIYTNNENIYLNNYLNIYFNIL